MERSSGAADNDITIRERHEGKKTKRGHQTKGIAARFRRRMTLQTMQSAWLTAAGRDGLIPSEKAIIAWRR